MENAVGRLLLLLLLLLVLLFTESADVIVGNVHFFYLSTLSQRPEILLLRLLFLAFICFWLQQYEKVGGPQGHFFLYPLLLFLPLVVPATFSFSSFPTHDYSGFSSLQPVSLLTRLFVLLPPPPFFLLIPPFQFYLPFILIFTFFLSPPPMMRLRLHSDRLFEMKLMLKNIWIKLAHPDSIDVKILLFHS